MNHIRPKRSSKRKRKGVKIVCQHLAWFEKEDMPSLEGWASYISDVRRNSKQCLTFIKSFMSKKVVIAGSASLQKKVQFWKKYWADKGYSVIDYSSPISKETFLEKYPQVHKDFFKNIIESDILFIMNENKNNIKGYLGAESFAEMCFGVTQNLIHNKNIEVILLQMPEKKVQSYDEIVLWLKLGWIKLYQE